MRGKLLDEVAHEAAQEGAAAEADLGHTGFEQLAGIQYNQIGVELGIHSHSRNDPDTQPKPHIGLDHVGIGGGEDHFRHETAMPERLVELGT